MLPYGRACWLLLAMAMMATIVECHKVEVFSSAELIEALNNESVDHIILAAPSWNITEEELPLGSAIISGRDVILEGATLPDGGQVYLDGNILMERIRVVNGGGLYQRNFWADHCIAPAFPYTCFSITSGNKSRVELQNMTLSDASCTHIKDSPGITVMVAAARYAKLLTVKVDYIDDRTVRMHDSGWVPYIAVSPAYWRFKNVTLTCTGNVTHALPLPNFVLVDRKWGRKEVGIATAFALVTLATVYWGFSRSNFSSVEHRLAQIKGYTLIIELGAGRGGKVYKARHRASGKLVAIKVINIKPTEWDQLRSVWRECQLMSTINHVSCIKILNFYSARVAHRGVLTRLARSGSGSSRSGFSSDGYETIELTKEFDDMGKQPQPQQPAAPTSASALSSMEPGKGAGGSLATATATSEDKSQWDGSGLQVHLVMAFADHGTLQEAVRSGKFVNADGTPNLPRIIATAMDIAEGVAYLHHPDRRLVHRDLSPSNVLIVSEYNDRGFRAVLSDFGLSTVVSLANTHKTSDTKGTVAYMPPECFSQSLISMQTDVYSLGVLLLFLLTKNEPYPGMTAGHIVHLKMTAGDGQVAVPAIIEESKDPRVKELVRIVRECTRFDRKDRPTADGIVASLTALMRLQ